MCRVIANGDGSTETAEAVDNFERWQLGSDDSLGAVDAQLQSMSQLVYHVEMQYVRMLLMLQQ